MVVEFVKEALKDRFITCRRCGNRIEADAEMCIYFVWALGQNYMTTLSR